MKHIFILDENVLISACRGVNVHNQEDYSSCSLILQIAENCHRIAWNNELSRRYNEKKDVLLKQKVGLFMQAYKVFFHLIINKDKNIQNENYLTLDPDLIHDRHIISLAVFTNGVLVTEDSKLRKRLVDKSLTARYNIIAINSKEALRYAKET